MSKKKQKENKPKILNFVEAYRLAILFHGAGIYKIPESLEGISEILNKIHHITFLEILMLLTGKSSEELGKLSGENVLLLLLSGLKLNKMNDFLNLVKDNGKLYGI